MRLLASRHLRPYTHYASGMIGVEYIVPLSAHPLATRRILTTTSRFVFAHTRAPRAGRVYIVYELMPMGDLRACQQRGFAAMEPGVELSNAMQPVKAARKVL